MQNEVDYLVLYFSIGFFVKSPSNCCEYASVWRINIQNKLKLSWNSIPQKTFETTPKQIECTKFNKDLVANLTCSYKRLGWKKAKYNFDGYLKSGVQIDNAVVMKNYIIFPETFFCKWRILLKSNTCTFSRCFISSKEPYIVAERIWNIECGDQRNTQLICALFWMAHGHIS